MNGLGSLPESTYYDITNKLLWPAITNISQQEMAKARAECVERARNYSRFPIILCCDGGWAHRGFHSKQACLPVIDFFSGKILFLFTAEHSRKYTTKAGIIRLVGIEELFVNLFVLQGGEGEQSVHVEGAEVFMMSLMLDELVEEEMTDFLYGFVIDSDSSATACIRHYPDPRLSTKHIFYDTGHGKKGLEKAVNALVGQSEVFGKLARRVGLMYMVIVNKYTELLFK